MKKSKLSIGLSCLLLGAQVLGGCNPPAQTGAAASPATPPESTGPVSSGAKSPGVAPLDQKDYVWKKATDPTFLIKTEEGHPFLYLNTQGSLKKLLPLTVLPTGRKLFHWTSPAFSETVDHANKMEPADLDVRVNQTGEPLQQGGGFYASSTPFNSQMYGTHMLIVEASRDLFIVPTELLRKHSELWTDEDQKLDTLARMEKINSINRGLRNAGVHGLIDADEGIGTMGWFNLIHPEAVSLIYGVNHPWMKGNAPEFHRLIRGQALSDTDKQTLAPKIVPILLQLIAASDEPTIRSSPQVREIKKQVPCALNEALLTAMEQEHYLTAQTAEEKKPIEGRLKSLQLTPDEVLNNSVCPATELSEKLKKQKP